MEVIYSDARVILIHLLAVYTNFKMAVYFDTVLQNYEQQVQRSRTFYTPSMIYADESLLFSNLSNAVQYLVAQLEYSSSVSGSGWILASIKRCEFRVSKYVAMRPKEYIPYTCQLKPFVKYCYNANIITVLYKPC